MICRRGIIGSVCRLNRKNPFTVWCKIVLRRCAAKFSEAVGLQLKHVDLDAGCIKIAQRHCRGDVDEPKTKNSKRVLALGALVDRYKEWIEKNGVRDPNAWIFAQEEDRSKPMWDSGVRKALKLAARACKNDPDDREDPRPRFPRHGPALLPAREHLLAPGRR